MGLVFIWTGAMATPIFGVEEAAVPTERCTWGADLADPTVSSAPASTLRNSITPEDLTDVTPESHPCMRRDAKASRKPWALYAVWFASYPSVSRNAGRCDLVGASFDPTLGFLFVNTNEIGAIGQMVEQGPRRENRFQREGAGENMRGSGIPHLWPCQKPPWGLLNAINVNSGEIAWRVPLGVNQELKARGLEHTGALNLGGSIATKGGLVFIAATNDKRFRAFEAATGREFWSSTIDGSGHATPMTFQGKSGRQFVVIAAGGGGFFGSTPADALVAFALPRKR